MSGCFRYPVTLRRLTIAGRRPTIRTPTARERWRATARETPERLAYDVFRAAGLPAPRCNNAVVYVNGAYYGVYVNVEAEDKTLLRRWFASAEGNPLRGRSARLCPGRGADIGASRDRAHRPVSAGLLFSTLPAEFDMQERLC